MIGWFGEDVWDAASDVVDAVTGAVADAVGIIPGVNALGDALHALVVGPLRDFARTSVGQVVFHALATSLTGGLAAFVGPQLATVAFAVPGLARGAGFFDAWVSEFSWRLNKLGEIAGGDVANVVQRQVGDTLAALAKQAPIDLDGIPAAITDTVRGFASRWHIREDAAALVIALWNHAPMPDLSRYNPETGAAPPSSLRELLDGAQVLERMPILDTHALRAATQLRPALKYAAASAVRMPTATNNALHAAAAQLGPALRPTVADRLASAHVTAAPTAMAARALHVPTVALSADADDGPSATTIALAAAGAGGLGLLAWVMLRRMRRKRGRR